MEIIDDAAVKFNLPVEISRRIISNVNRSEQVGDEVLVYWGHGEAEFVTKVLDERLPQVLTKVPSPMERDYKWPGFYKPFTHQKETAGFLSLRPRAFCFNEAGTGKTSAAIWAADYLMNLGLVKRVLVICPLSIMYSAWQADILQTAMHRSVAVAYGTGSKRAKIINDKYEFIIINYDGINVVYDEIANAKFDLIIVDEANAYKSSNTKRWKTLAKLVTPATRLWMMTGTPASQSPVDAFGLARLVAPDRVPRFSTAWKDKVMTQIAKFRWVPKQSAKDDVFNALQPAIRFTKKECLDLPPLVYQTRDVPMTTQQSVFYKKLKEDMLIEAAGEEVSAVNAAAKLNKLLQLSGGAVYTDKGDVVEFDVSPRLSALSEVLDETSNKVLVFVPYLHTLQLVRNYLVKEGVTSEIINGDVSAKERATIITRFQAMHDPRVLLIQPQAASHGVTLTAADTVVFWSPVMSVDTYIQCVARVDRVGQKNSMTVVHLQSSEVERKVYKMLQQKVDMHQELVNLYKQELGI